MSLTLTVFKAQVGVALSLQLVALAPWLLLTYTAASRRQMMRQELCIVEHEPVSFMNEWLMWTFCYWFPLAQESRTLEHNRVENGKWLGPCQPVITWADDRHVESTAPNMPLLELPDYFESAARSDQQQGARQAPDWQHPYQYYEQDLPVPEHVALEEAAATAVAVQEKDMGTGNQGVQQPEHVVDMPFAPAGAAQQQAPAAAAGQQQEQGHSRQQDVQKQEEALVLHVSAPAPAVPAAVQLPMPAPERMPQIMPSSRRHKGRQAQQQDAGAATAAAAGDPSSSPSAAACQQPAAMWAGQGHPALSKVSPFARLSQRPQDLRLLPVKETSTPLLAR